MKNLNEHIDSVYHLVLNCIQAYAPPPPSYKTRSPPRLLMGNLLLEETHNDGVKDSNGIDGITTETIAIPVNKINKNDKSEKSFEDRFNLSIKEVNWHGYVYDYDQYEQNRREAEALENQMKLEAANIEAQYNNDKKLNLVVERKRIDKQVAEKMLAEAYDPDYNSNNINSIEQKNNSELNFGSRLDEGDFNLTNSPMSKTRSRIKLKIKENDDDNQNVKNAWKGNDR